MPTIIMQERFGEAEYAIGRLVLERARALGLSRSALVRRLGYKDINAGHRALVGLLMTGIVSPFFARRLADALEAGASMISTAIRWGVFGKSSGCVGLGWGPNTATRD
jgi:hypothetical protein